MTPFIPNDKFNISGLHACWNFLLENPNKTDESYFCELAAKTFQLFYHYRQDDNIPREITRLIPVITLYSAAGVFGLFSFEDISKRVANELICQLTDGFKSIKNPDTGRLSPAGEWFAVSYQDGFYQINTQNFDLTPIKRKCKISI